MYVKIYMAIKRILILIYCSVSDHQFYIMFHDAFWETMSLLYSELKNLQHIWIALQNGKFTTK